MELRCLEMTSRYFRLSGTGGAQIKMGYDESYFKTILNGELNAISGSPGESIYDRLNKVKLTLDPSFVSMLTYNYNQKMYFVYYSSKMNNISVVEKE